MGSWLRYDPAMPTKKADANREIYISELAEIVNREIGTIRKWEHDGRLPKHLLPKRGERSRRYWTHKQVYGDRGIIKWMKRNDMRPGREFADPANADDHVRNLRRPKFISKHLVDLVKTMVKDNRSAKEIVEEVYPHTKYTSRENLEKALRTYFKKQEWEFPPKQSRTARAN